MLWFMAISTLGGRIASMSIQEIEQAIAQLPKNQLVELMTWLADYHHQVWDEQIERDLAAGRLDSVIAAAEKEYEAGLARPL
jgi:hypothetical protein